MASQIELGLTPLNEDTLLNEAIISLRNLENVVDVGLVEQGSYATFQYLLRIVDSNGQVFRFGISCVEDEEEEEAFDSTFVGHFVEQAFEEIGCSCQPLREKLIELEAELFAELRQQKLDFVQTKRFAEIGKLKNQIAEIDRKEHIFLDLNAREALPALAAWLQEQIAEDNLELGELVNSKIALAFAKAWFGGWRPRPPESEKG